MSELSAPPLPTEELVARLINAERTCMVDWLQAMQTLAGNPLRVTVEQFGNATALVCGAIPAQVFNRVIGMTASEIAHIPAILALYANYGVEPMFDLSPYAVPPFWVQPSLTAELHKHGFYQGAWHQILYGLPASHIPKLPSGLAIRPAKLNEADIFVSIYEQVWGDGTSIRVLLDHPNFTCYLAYVDEVPAALGVLHMANGVASMANGLTVPAMRAKGCQTALLYGRIHDAAVAGCDLMVSQSMPGVTSQNNQIRTGFQIAGSKAWWIPAPT